MRAPLSWLKDFTPLTAAPDDAVALRAVTDALDSLGLVVESTELVGAGLNGVVLARVLEIRAIPGADRIRHVTADRGDGEPLQIVCGATNFVAGDVVPLAPTGTELPGGIRIERRMMRGVESNGMLCSGRELGLSDDGAGLMILASPGADAPLPAGFELGTPLTEHLGMTPDAVFDIAVEPNRPDCLSIAGIARDLAARLSLPFAIPAPVVRYDGDAGPSLASVVTNEVGACDRLVGRVLRGVANVASPTLVQRRLTLAGMRPLGAVIDASNYVMLELGQPTHPYDLDRLAGKGIAVRFARRGEQLVLLDGETHDLVEEDLVITDAADAVVGLAGVMGGAGSGISDETSVVLLEVAHFDPVVVGRAAARHGMRTEASVRFWRGTDPDGVERAADRFSELVTEAVVAAGLAAPVVAPGGPLDDRRDGGRPHITLRTARLNALLGTELSSDAIVAYLAPIGFASVPVTGGLEVEVPSFRPDATREVDLIEEVARHHGYEHIAPTERRSPRVGQLSEAQLRRRRLLRVLQGMGGDEAWTSSIVDPEIEALVGAAGNAIVVSNPIVGNETTLRTRLLAGLLGALRHNEGHRNGDLALFELGRVFAVGEDAKPIEREELGVVLARPGDDARAAVALVGLLAEGLGIIRDAYVLDQETTDHGALAGLHPARRALLRDRRGDPRRRRVVGAVGEVDTATLAALGLAERRVGWVNLELDAFFALARRSPLARPVSHFPSADLDFAFVLDDAVRAADLEETLRRGAGELAESVLLLDVYRGPGIPPGTRSLTYRVRFCALDHTLGVDEIAAARAAAISFVESHLPAKLRA